VKAGSIPVRRIAKRSAAEFFADGAPKLAAAISYYALFSLFPLTILVVAVLSRLVDDDAARDAVIQAVLDVLPLREERGRADLRELLEQATAAAGTSGVFAALGLLLSASAVMGAIRFALNTIWGRDDVRPPLAAKALDIALAGLAGLGLVVSLAATILVPRLTSLPEPAQFLVSQLLPLALAFAVFLVLFCVVPATETRAADVWPGALVGAAGYGLAKFGFSVYLGSVADFAAVYASLATVVAFLVFTWLGACLMLLGAEVAVASELARRGQLPPDEPDPRPLAVRIRSGLRGFVVRSPARRTGPPAD